MSDPFDVEKEASGFVHGLRLWLKIDEQNVPTLEGGVCQLLTRARADAVEATERADIKAQCCHCDAGNAVKFREENDEWYHLVDIGLADNPDIQEYYCDAEGIHERHRREEGVKEDKRVIHPLVDYGDGDDGLPLHRRGYRRGEW